MVSITRGLAAFAMTIAACVAPARAVLIGPGTGTQNTTSSAEVPAWHNVGRISVGTGVYLGNQWVLTAAHVDPVHNPSIDFYPSDTFPFQPTTVGLDPNNFVQLRNADNSFADMVLIHTTSDPGLPTLNLAPATPAPGTAISMVGFGVDRGAAVQYLVIGNNWTEVSAGGNYSGYKFDPTGGRSKRWGTNLTSTFPNGLTTDLASNPGNQTSTTVFTTEFNSPSNNPTGSEAIGISGDSGGAVFADNSNTLLGIMLYQDQLNVPPGQPFDVNNHVGTAIYGNGTDSGNIATYLNQIRTTTGIPEPSSMVLLAAAGIVLIARRSAAPRRP